MAGRSACSWSANRWRSSATAGCSSVRAAARSQPAAADRSQAGRSSASKLNPMPLQNRVTPFGDIVAIPQRGIFTRNRGIIHDPATRTLLKRRGASKAWLVCLCEFRGRRRTVMSGRSWTELFFLDEAVALAAGHRPCFFCRRQAAQAFRYAWAQAREVNVPLALGCLRSRVFSRYFWLEAAISWRISAGPSPRFRRQRRCRRHPR